MATKAPPRYDDTSKDSIRNHASSLIGRTLHEIYPEACNQGRKRGKGYVGNLVEKLHFGLEINNQSRPDFPDAGLELKTTAVVLRNDGLVAKERLSLSMIDYKGIVGETFYTSAFQKKNASLLIVVYLYEKNQEACHNRFLYSFIFEVPKEDRSQIEQDWNKIREKVTRGEAHSLSEGDTFYLAAATKGSNSSDLTEQPNGGPKAKRRAYCFKQSYLKQIIKAHIDGDYQKAVSVFSKISKSENEISIEEAVIERCARYVGHDAKALSSLFGLPTTRAKNWAGMLVKRMLGFSADDEIAEFLKSGINVKTVTTTDGRRLKESMSFARIDYDAVVSEEWESCYWNNVVTNKFLIMVFDKETRTSRSVFRGAFFWSLPSEAEDDAYDYWNNIKNLVQAGDFQALYKLKSEKYFHVRPKARNAKDMCSINGKRVKKMAYWINREVVCHELIAQGYVTPPPAKSR